MFLVWTLVLHNGKLCSSDKRSSSNDQKMKSAPEFCGLVFTCLLSLSEPTQTPQKAVSPQGTDCTQIKALTPNATSGVYLIQPPGMKSPFRVYCEMLPDGGWTVFQRRTGGAVSFSRKWAAYESGFGNVASDHWLGLKKVFCLTKKKNKNWIMRVDLWDFEGGSSHAEYKDFRLGSKREEFKLNVGEYSGDAGDAIRGAYPGIDQNGFGFSTIDRDNDGCSPCIFGDIAQNDCAFSEGGGWWFSRCGSANLNGDWHGAGDNIFWASGVHWLTWKGPAPYSAKASRMMVKSV